jgi:2-keto-4-pentenoate hydratase
MAEWDTKALAQEFLGVREKGGALTPPSHRYQDWNLAAAYEVGGELYKSRRENGWVPAGRKIGFTNKTIWPSLGMDTVIWAYTYRQTVSFATADQAELALANTYSCLIEPEIVFKLKAPITANDTEATIILEKVEWLALGYEVVDCNFPEWKFVPTDAVADFGLHFRLIIGETFPVTDSARLASELRTFRATLFKDGEVAARGTGSDVLDSPALALGWLARTLEQQQAAPLAAGEIVTTGTITPAPIVQPGETWHTTVEDIQLSPLTLRFT